MTTKTTSSADNSLETLIQRKLQLEEDLKSIEKQIFDLEESYLEETNHYGNIVKGWEGFLNSKPTKPLNSTRKIKIADKERVFSQSSTTAPTQMDEEEEDDLYSDAGRTGTSIGRLGRTTSSKGFTDDDNDSTMST